MAHKLRKLNREHLVRNPDGGFEILVKSHENVYAAIPGEKKLDPGSRNKMPDVPEGATPATHPWAFTWKVKCAKSDALTFHVKYDSAGRITVSHTGRPPYQEYSWNGKSLFPVTRVGTPLTHGQQADIARSLSTVRF
jgi:hypothetical protein